VSAVSAAAMPEIDETHDPGRRSWVASANGHPDFPVQNLPLGVFSPPGGGAGPPRAGAAIGDMVLDLAAAHAAGLFSGEAARAAEYPPREVLTLAPSICEGRWRRNRAQGCPPWTVRIF
jgi:fumarylacetoacetase